jgi:energy-coupling factor transporter ATP-binding protein EcfA2
LKGLSNENFDAISNNLELTFQLPNFATPHKLSFRFTGSEIIPKRINILIGKNGLGKSQALNRFCRCALQHKNEKAILRDESNDSSRPMINRLIAIGTPGETSNTFPGEHLETQKLHYRRVNLTRGSKVKLTQNLSNSLIQLVRSEDYIGEQSRWEIFLESIDKAIDSNQIHILLKDGTSCPLKKLPGYSGEQHSLELWTNIDSSKEPIFVHNDHKAPLSSGQLTFFKFAVYCSLMIENGCFVLMDEPETHLHPNLISDFVELLDTLLEKTGSYAIIATHSAYFVREVSREQVHIFKSDGTNISIEQPRLKTFGADIDSISEFIFEDNISNRMLKRIAEKAVNKSYDEIKNEIGSEISYQALMSLREMKRGLNE